MKGRTVKLASEMSEIPASVWDGLACPADAARNPFTSHAFLHALEASGSVGGATGWHPAHVVLEDSGRFVAVAPAYIKSFPLCPAGGAYTTAVVGTNPSCSKAAAPDLHVLP